MSNGKTAFEHAKGGGVIKRLGKYERQSCGLSNTAVISDFKKHSQLPGKVYHPWHAVIQHSNGKDTQCGGVVINKNWVLTVAHCFHTCAYVNGSWRRCQFLEWRRSAESGA